MKIHIIDYYKNNTINKMINNYKQFVNEKLSDKISGFDKDGLKEQFLNGKISFYKFLTICKKYNIKLPSNEEVKQMYLSGLIDIDEYLDIWFQYNTSKISDKELHQTITEINDNVDMLYYAIIYNFLDLVKLAFSKCDKSIIDNVFINVAFEDAIKRNRIDVVKYLLSVGFKIYNYQKEYAITDEMKNIVKKYV